MEVSSKDLPVVITSTYEVLEKWAEKEYERYLKNLPEEDVKKMTQQAMGLFKGAFKAGWITCAIGVGQDVNLTARRKK